MSNAQEQLNPGSSAGPPEARAHLETGRQLLALAESAVIGRQPCGSVSEARGLALAGVRAATLDPPDLAGAGEFPAVHYLRGYHRRIRAAVALAAGSHQAAVGLVPVAHLLAAQLRRPVAVWIDPGVWDRLGAATLPLPLPHGEADLVELDFPGGTESAAQILQLMASVPEAVPAALEWNGGGGQAPAILTVGAFEQEIETLVRSSGGALAHLCLRLARPLPVEQLGRLLRGRQVFLAGPTDSPVHHEILDGLRDAQSAGLIELAGLLPLPAPSSADAAGLAILLAEAVPDLALEPEAAATGLRWGVSPGGRWARRLLLDIGAGLSRSVPAGTAGPWSEAASTELSQLAMGSATGEELDLLVAVDNPVVDPTPAIRRLRAEGTLIYQSPAGDPVAAWARIPVSARQLIRERRLRFWWVGARVLEQPADLADAYRALLGAKAAHELSARVADRFRPAVPLVRDAKGVIRLDPGTLDAGLEPGADEILLGRLPQMPAAAAGGTSKWRQALRQFHLSGTPLGTEWCWNPDVPLVPAAVLPAVREESLLRSFPYFIPAGAASSPPRPLADLLDELTAETGDAGLIRRMLPALLEAVGGRAEDSDSPKAVVDAAASRVASLLEVSPEGRTRFQGEQRALVARLPAEGRVERFVPEAWMGFLAAAASAQRKAERRSVRRQWERLVDELEALLLADHQLSAEASSASGISAGLGEAGPLLLVPSRLAQSATRRTGSRGLGEERRSRIREARRRLESFLAESAAWPEVWLVHDPEVTMERTLAGWAVVNPGTEPFGAAAGLFDGLAARLVEAARAARIARLECSNDFDPDRHMDAVRRLSWEGLDSAEMTLLPLVVVFETTGRLIRGTLDAFSRLVRSARPIKMVLAEPETIVQEGGRLQGILPDIGYLALGHREALVIQCALSQPDRLLEGFTRLVASHRTGIAVVSLPDPGEDRDLAWHRWVTAVQARAFPAFQYDPAAGESWAERFSLAGNREPELAWLQSTWEYADAEGNTGTLTEALTYAHVAVQNPLLRRHFCVIPPEAWSDDQVPVSEYLSAYQTVPPDTLPYLWILDADGVLQRALVTRELVSAARDRSRAWRLLQELAGVRSVYVDRAVAATEQALVDQRGGDEEVLVEAARRQGAVQAVEQILSRLVGLASGQEPPPAQGESAIPAPVAVPAAAAAISPAVPTAVVPETPSPAEAESVDAPVAAEAYIDSFLCTSCNECTNLNPRMFKYNHDKQAYLADLDAGTYVQLVKAAEACPARCIHPGEPRPGDSTATAEVVARAKPFM